MPPRRGTAVCELLGIRPRRLVRLHPCDVAAPCTSWLVDLLIRARAGVFIEE